MTLTVFGCDGRTLINAVINPGPPNVQCSSVDVNADQLPQQNFDNTGRAEISAALAVGPGTLRPGSLFATAQVFDNATGKTTAMLGKGVPGGGD